VLSEHHTDLTFFIIEIPVSDTSGVMFSKLLKMERNMRQEAFGIGGKHPSQQDPGFISGFFVVFIPL
jgi:hypothetical protein